MRMTVRLLRLYHAAQTGAHTARHMLSIGLQNPGIDVFMQRDIPFLKQYDTKIIVNVCGNPHSNDRNFDGGRRLINHAHRYRLDGRTGHAPRLVCKGKGPPVNINLHAR